MSPKSRRMRLAFVVVVLVCSVMFVASAGANTSHDGWPTINGMLLMNKTDSDRPLDARPGHDPFAGADPDYSCDELHLRGDCQTHFVAIGADAAAPAATRGRRDPDVPLRLVVADERVHNELLGGHGDDTIHAGPVGDVLWGDYKPSGQPTRQHDVMFGGAGRDFIYASHGRNEIRAGAGNDWLKAHFGRGTINCGPGTDVLYVSRKAQRQYTIRNCERISHKTLGF